MSTGKTETAAVSKVAEAVNASKILKADFAIGDRTPIWDGYIYIYSSQNHKNNNFKNRIPVQIKGTVVKRLSGVTKKYQIRINDLKAYLKDGGSIYFVVEISNSKKANIYYINLFPLTIDDLLTNTKEGQKTLFVDLKLLDISSSEQIENICHEFIFHRKRQFSTIEHRIDLNNMQDIEKLSYTVFSPKGSLYESIFQDDVVLYGQRKNDTIFLPIDNVKVSAIAHLMSYRVTIGSRVYFENYKAEKSLNQNIIILGENIRLNFEEGKLEFKFKGNLNIRLKEAEFLLDLSLHKSFYIGKHKVGGFKIEEFEKEKVKENYKLLLDIKKTLNSFNVDEDLELNSLTKNEFEVLQLLIELVIYNDYSKYQNKLPTNRPVYCEIQNITIAIMIIDKNNELQIFDFFDCNDELSVRLIDEENNINEQGCLYTILKAENIININNLSLAKIEHSIISTPYSEAYSIHVNMLVLELIKAYDLKNELVGCLSTSIKLSEWLYENNEDSEYCLVNKYQAIKRMRPLSKEEKNELMKIRSESHDGMMLCGISIVLENKTDYEYYLEELSEEDKQAFIQFPIYKLAEIF